MAQSAVDWLAAEGLQSDGRFMESFVRSRVAKGYGELRIRQELRCKGLDRQETDAVLAPYDWDELLAEVHRKKFGQGGPGSQKESAARHRFLQQRGFSASAIGGLLRRLRRDDD